MYNFNNFFLNKKVLITGHTGFKGSWLCLWLHLAGAKVIGVSKDLPTSPSHFEKLKLNIRGRARKLAFRYVLKRKSKNPSTKIILLHF